MRTLLAPVEAEGRLSAVTRHVRDLGRAHGTALAISLPCIPPPAEQEAQVIDACRRFVERPMARMVGICTIMFRAT